MRRSRALVWHVYHCMLRSFPHRYAPTVAAGLTGEANGEAVAKPEAAAKTDPAPDKVEESPPKTDSLRSAFGVALRLGSPKLWHARLYSPDSNVELRRHP